jgi:hypothetical protein
MLPFARYARDVEPRQNALEIPSMQNIELAKRHPASADLLHRRLIFAAPGVGKGMPVAGMAERTEEPFRLARNTGAPIHERAEDIKKQCADRRHLQSSNLDFGASG